MDFLNLMCGREDEKSLLHLIYDCLGLRFLDMDRFRGLYCLKNVSFNKSSDICQKQVVFHQDGILIHPNTMPFFKFHM